MKKNMFASRRFKHGSLATIITVGFIVGIVLVNVIATMLLQRFPLTIDLTKDNRFAITEPSIEFVKAIDSDVTISICADEAALEMGTDSKQALEIIRSYAKYSGKIKIEFINLTKDPNFAKKHPKETFTSGDIFISADKRTKKVNINDLFTQQQNQQTGEVKTTSKAEQVLTGALMYATDENPVTVSVLGGNDSMEIDGYMNVLKANNYNVVEQNILTDEIDPAASFVVLPQPAVDFTADTIKKLDDFLDNDSQFNKSLVFIASPSAEIGPLLKNFLAQWGMEIGAETIIETDPSHVIMQNPLNIINEVKDEDFKKSLISQEQPIITPYARPINILFEQSENRSTKVLMSSYATSVLMPVTANETFDPSKETQAAFNTMVIGTKSKYEGTTLHASNVVAIASPVLTSDNLSRQTMGYIPPANSDAVLAMTSLISPKSETVRINPISLDQEKITVTGGQVMVLLWIFVIAIPLVVVIMGFVVWIRRRHL